MTYARKILIPKGSPGTFHCVSRCVRRAFLCGEDRLTGRSFEHRRQWVEDRIHELAGIFGVAIWGYAVMSNHLHVVVQILPEEVALWSKEDVVKRWMRLYPRQDRNPEMRAEVLAGNAERIKELRERLSNLSWFMRCLVEPIARAANKEGHCRLSPCSDAPNRGRSPAAGWFRGIFSQAKEVAPMKKLLVIAVLMAPVLVQAQQPSTQQMPPPPVGVYSCFGQYGIAPPMTFGLLDAETYADFDGKTGSYIYDSASGVLTLTTGGLAGTKYRRTGKPTDRPAFRMLDAQGQLTAYMCPRDDKKDPRKHPW